MNNPTKRGILVMACCMGAGLSQASVAADATGTTVANAIIDWSNLQLSVTGINDTVPTIAYSNQYTSLSSYASSPGLNESNSKTVNNWTEGAGTNADAGTTSANTVASTMSFSGMANSSENGSASSSGSRTLNFSLDGPGLLTVTVPYTISLTGSTSGCYYYCYDYDHASVSGSANFYSYGDNGNSDSYSSTSFSLYSSPWDPSPPESQSGTLVFGVFANGAGNGSLGLSFDLSTGAASMVPETKTYAMLLAGLGLMGAVIRRRRMMGTQA
ncbi:MAG: hypothetical protein H0X43_12370 [Nitrosospira sp.]|nr:hypothetical protein [Nitrosospira sp.]